MRLNIFENGKKTLKPLSNPNRNGFEFLGYVLDLDSREVYDSLRETTELNKAEFKIIQSLLTHFSNAKPVERTGKLIRFADLPGGLAYEKAFLQRAIQPIAEAFGHQPESLIQCAKRLNGFALSFGDFSVEIPALPRIPLTVILWEASEFSLSATILYDDSAWKYLPTEDLAVLGELTTARLLQVLGIFEMSSSSYV